MFIQRTIILYISITPITVLSILYSNDLLYLMLTPLMHIYDELNVNIVEVSQNHAEQIEIDRHAIISNAVIPTIELAASRNGLYTALYVMITYICTLASWILTAYHSYIMQLEYKFTHEIQYLKRSYMLRYIHMAVAIVETQLLWTNLYVGTMLLNHAEIANIEIDFIFEMDVFVYKYIIAILITYTLVTNDKHNIYLLVAIACINTCTYIEFLYFIFITILRIKYNIIFLWIHTTQRTLNLQEH